MTQPSKREAVDLWLVLSRDYGIDTANVPLGADIEFDLETGELMYQCYLLDKATGQPIVEQTEYGPQALIGWTSIQFDGSQEPPDPELITALSNRSERQMLLAFVGEVAAWEVNGPVKSLVDPLVQLARKVMVELGYREADNETTEPVGTGPPAFEGKPEPRTQ